MPEMAKLTLILLVVCLVSAAALSQTYETTKEKIQANRTAKEANARKAVLDGATRVELDRKVSKPDFEVYRGLDGNGTTVGYAFKVTEKGFSGDVVVMVGAKKSASGLVVSGTQLLRHTETPGLGANMEARSYDIERQAMDPIPGFQKQFIGRAAHELLLKKSAAAGTIDSLTAATISSKAFTKAVRSGLDKLSTMLSERSS